MQRYAVVGGGILGAAVTRQLLERDPSASVTLLEKEHELALHQTGRNSGVVHAGLYYVPGSLKARLCRRGVSLLYDFCATEGIRYEQCGKVLVALDEAERGRLHEIADRAERNGVPGVQLLSPDQLNTIEPHVRGVAALHSPTTAIVDFAHVTRSLAAAAERAGAVVRTGSEVTKIDSRGREVVLAIGEEEIAYDQVIVCGGLQSDRLGVLAGGEADPRIVPFRGEYYRLTEEKRSLVRGLVYPVPDPRYPFLGVHLTPRVDGEVLIGPNAVLALAREKYRRGGVSRRDLLDTLRYTGFRRFAQEHWRTGARELWGSFSKHAFMDAARKYVPDLSDADVVPGPVGIRAQALDDDGALVDDFRIVRQGRVTVVRNAPSPAATSGMAIAEHLVALFDAGTPNSAR